MTVAVKRHWVYRWVGELCSDLALLGAASRETTRNDSLGCVAGWETAEINAWLNNNAFLARLTVHEVRNFEDCGTWAFQDALEQDIQIYAGHHTAPSRTYKAEVLFNVAAVWVSVAGRYMFDRLKLDPEVGVEGYVLFWTRPHWDKWRRMFEDEAQKVQYSNEVTTIAKECTSIMTSFSATSTVD